MLEMKLMVTNACNLNCSYCYERKKNNIRMPQDIGINAIDFYIENAIPGSVAKLNFHGGEPLLEFGLIKYLTQYFKEKVVAVNIKPEFSMTTNGVLVTPEMVDFFKANNFNISVSLDGKKETHDMHRKTTGNIGSFDKVFNAARLLNEKGCRLNIRLTVTPDNIDFLVDNVKWLVSEGFTRIYIGVNFLSDWDQYFNKLENAYYRVKQFYLNNSVNNQYFFNIFDGKFPQYMLSGKPLFCDAGFRNFTVSASGKLYPCVYVVENEEFCFGELGRGIFGDKRKACLQKYICNMDMCSNCNIAYFCHGRKCGFLNYSVTGSLNKPSSFLCRHEKLLYKLVGEVVDELYSRGDTNINNMFHILKGKPELEINEAVRKYLVN